LYIFTFNPPSIPKFPPIKASIPYWEGIFPLPTIVEHFGEVQKRSNENYKNKISGKKKESEITSDKNKIGFGNVRCMGADGGSLKQ
jgi:hypothetical protein